MQRDAHGLPVTLSSAEAATAFDAVVSAYLAYAQDAPQKLKAFVALDPEAPFAGILRGSFAMLTYNAAALPSARKSAALAVAAGGTPRERAHAGALSAWADGESDQALAIWEAILAEHPTDALAVRLHHFVAFWLGRGPQMAAAIERVGPHWDRDLTHWASYLACRCFAFEEVGRYAEAEAAGRRAVELVPTDVWAAHGVAHVLEMQGRRGEGIAWLDGLEPQWQGANSIRHHLLWHRALFHHERGDRAAVLRLYDEGFRNLNSPLTQALPDMFVDIQNAASMLFRLSLQGVDVGDRWTELADKAEGRLDDTQSAFTLPHWMMALGATGRFHQAAHLLHAVAEAARGTGTNAAILARSGLPACRAVLHHARGEHEQAVAALRPALSTLGELGGSHAQQAVLEILFLDSAAKAGLTEDARTLLERAAGRCPVPPARRVDYAAIARQVAH
ncbi:tetratricopeptide repeat protein [Humitalea sp. 24SJ18S-53]|uniref:tetratricopeptide repeat protein n=1 Tax=Humitalea sp. 24SJ18S-53 TaxID=3422307 RepID=UPI003D666910